MATHARLLPRPSPGASAVPTRPHATTFVPRPSVTPITAAAATAAAVAPSMQTTTTSTTAPPSEGTEVLSSFLWFHQDRYWNEAAHLLPQVLRLPAKPPTTVTVPSKMVTTAKTITKKRTKQSNKRATPAATTTTTPTTIRRTRTLASRRSTPPVPSSIPSSPISASSPASSPLLPSSPAQPTLSPSSPSSLSYSASSLPPSTCGSVPLARHPVMSIAALLN